MSLEFLPNTAQRGTAQSILRRQRKDQGTILIGDKRGDAKPGKSPL